MCDVVLVEYRLLSYSSCGQIQCTHHERRMQFTFQLAIFRVVSPTENIRGKLVWFFLMCDEVNCQNPLCIIKLFVRIVPMAVWLGPK